MYFSGRLPKPPWETRSAVEALVKRYDRGFIQNYGDRFRFQTLQSRCAGADRSLGQGPSRRAKKGGRGRSHTRATQRRRKPRSPKNRSFTSRRSATAARTGQAARLYESLAEARHEVGMDPCRSTSSPIW